jgi:hypothetical protein
MFSNYRVIAAAMTLGIGLASTPAFARNAPVIAETIARDVKALGLDPSQTTDALVPVFKGSSVENNIPDGYQAWIDLPDGRQLVVNMDSNGNEIGHYQRAGHDITTQSAALPRPLTGDDLRIWP